MFSGFPQRLRLQHWLIENPAPGAQKGVAGGCFQALNAPREPIFWVRTHFSSQLWTNSVLTQNLIFWRVKDQFWLFEALFELPEPASVGGATFEGSLKTFLRDLDEVGE